MHWSEGDWKAPETWLEEIEQNIIALKARVKRGGDFDRWDLKIKNGIFSTAKGILTIEEHGANKQYLKFRYWINYSRVGLLLIIFLAFIAILAAADKSWIVSLIIAGLTVGLIGKYVFDCVSVATCLVSAFTELTPLAEKKITTEAARPEERREAERKPIVTPGAQREVGMPVFTNEIFR